VELHQRDHSAATAHGWAAGAPALLQFECLTKKNARCPGLPEVLRKACPGWMAELRPLFPGGAGGAKPLLLRASFLVFKETAAIAAATNADTSARRDATRAADAS
jgi:hypothetical protein